MALSPWPTEAAKLATALDALGAQGIAGEEKRLTQIASMVSARVEKEAPEAPESAKDEAVVRGVGYLLEAGSGAIRMKEVDVLKTEHAPSHSRWWYNSGAASILSPWYAPRGGIIG